MADINIGWQGAVALCALGLSVYNTIRQHREYKWKQHDRDDEQRRRAWCLKKCADLRLIRAPLAVKDSEREWALWGEKNGYFLAKWLEDGSFELHAAEGKAWLDRELMALIA
jgi:hypothetical protein